MSALNDFHIYEQTKTIIMTNARCRVMNQCSNLEQLEVEQFSCGNLSRTHLKLKRFGQQFRAVVDKIRELWNLHKAAHDNFQDASLDLPTQSFIIVAPTHCAHDKLILSCRRR